MTNRRAITASKSAATRRAGKQEKEMFTNEHPTVPSYIMEAMSGALCCASPGEWDVSGEK